VHITQVLHIFRVDSYVHAHIRVLLHISPRSGMDKLWLIAQTFMNQAKLCGIVVTDSVVMLDVPRASPAGKRITSLKGSATGLGYSESRHTPRG
jgi:hypothetical protein